LSTRAETPGVNPIKVGEPPGQLVAPGNAEPSPDGRDAVDGRCRERTVGA
jgi:hypothetical protein